MIKTVFATLTAAATAGLMAFAPAPAQAATFTFGVGDQMVGNYCNTHSRDRDCRDYRRGHHNWNETRYRNFFGSHGLSFNFTVNTDTRYRDSRGRLSSSHIQRCEDRFRSYDRRTDTYLGYDGDRHYCTL